MFSVETNLLSERNLRPVLCGAAAQRKLIFFLPSVSTNQIIFHMCCAFYVWIYSSLRFWITLCKMVGNYIFHLPGWAMTKKVEGCGLLSHCVLANHRSALWSASPVSFCSTGLHLSKNYNTSGVILRHSSAVTSSRSTSGPAHTVVS